MRALATSLILLLLAVLVRADPGVLTTSDGRTFEGDITWTRGRPLKLFDAKAKKWYEIRAGEVLRIRCGVTHEADEKAWVWVEDGRQEKIFTGETYPVRDVETEITLRSGAVYRGDVRAVLYVRDDAGKKKRFFLKSRFKGERGQTQADVVHVAQVRFEGDDPDAATRPSILVRADGLGGVVSVHAVERTNDLHFEARKTKDGWLLGGLIPGTYDLAIVAKDGVRLWMQAAFRGDRRTLSPEDESAVAARISEIEDFFPEHETLLVFGSRKKARALVCKVRTGATSMSEEGQTLFRRLEVWTLHHFGARWYVDGIALLYRERGDPFALEHARPVEADRRLAGIVVTSDRKTVDVDLGAPPASGDGTDDTGEDR